MVVVHHTSYSNSLFSSVVNYLTRIRNSPQYIFLLNCSIRSCRFWAILATLFLHHTLYDVFTRESSSLCVLRDCLAWIQARNTYIRRRNTVCKCIHLLCQTKANSIVKQLVCGGYCWHEKIWWQSFFFLVIANTLQFCSTFDEDKYIFFNKVSHAVIQQQTPRLASSYTKVNIHSRLQLYKSMSSACKVSKLSIVGGVKVGIYTNNTGKIHCLINSFLKRIILDNWFGLNFGWLQ